MEILDNNFETNTCVSKSTLEFTYSKKNGGSEVEITPTPIEEGDKYIAGPFVAIKNSSNMILPVQNDINVFDGRTPKLSELFGVHVINKPLGFKKIGIIQSSDIQISYIFDEIPSFVDNKNVLIGYQINGVNHDKVEVTIDDNNVDFVTLNKDDYRVEETKRVLLTSRGRDGELTHGYFTNGVDAYFSDGTIGKDKIITDRITECFFYEKINGQYVNIPVEEVIYGADREFYYKAAYDTDNGDTYKSISKAAFDKSEEDAKKLKLYVKKFTDDVYHAPDTSDPKKPQPLLVHKGDIVTLENGDHVKNNIEYASLENNFSLHHYIECNSISELVTTDGYGDACRMTTSEIGDYIQKIEADFRNYVTTVNNSNATSTGDINLKFTTAKNDENDVQNDMKMVHLPKSIIPFLKVEETQMDQRINTNVNLYKERRKYRIPNGDETWKWDITVNNKVYEIDGSIVLDSFDFVVPSDAYEHIFTEKRGVLCNYYGVDFSSGSYSGEVGDDGYNTWVEKVLKTIIIYNVSLDTSGEIRWTEKNAGAHKQFICYLKEYLGDSVTNEEINNGKFKTKCGFIFDNGWFYGGSSKKEYDLPVRIYRVDDANKEGENVLSKDYWCDIMLLDGRILKFRFRRVEVEFEYEGKLYTENGFMEGIGLERKLKNDSGGYTEYKINVRDDDKVVLTLNLGNVGKNNKRVLLHPVMCQSSFQDLVEEVVDYYNGDEMQFTTTSDGMEWYGLPKNKHLTTNKSIEISNFNHTDGYDFFYRLKRKLVGDNVIQYFYTSIYNACVPNVVILTTKKVEPTQGDDQSVQSTTVVVSKYVVFTGTKSELNECWGDNDKSCRYLKYYKFSVNIFTGTDDNRNTIMLGEVGELEEHKYDVTQDNNTTTSTFRGKKVDVSFVEGNLEDYTLEITDITGMKILFKNTSTSWGEFKNIEKTINESTTNQENGE